jgi:two-component system response regulator DevR
MIETDRVIKILIVEDQRMLAESLAMRLGDERDIAIEGIAGDAATALAMLKRVRPDVVVMDHHLAGPMDGVEATMAIHRSRPELPVVMLTGDLGDDVLLAALNAGMSGFVVKNEALENLVDAVRRAAAGEMVWPAERLARLLAKSRHTLERPSPELTDREADILRLMGEGLDNKVIAQRLSLSLATVRGYVQQVLAKLGAHSKLEAVVIASRTGLLRQISREN